MPTARRGRCRRGRASATSGTSSPRNGQVIADAPGTVAAANYGTVPAFGFTPERQRHLHRHPGRDRQGRDASSAAASRYPDRGQRRPHHRSSPTPRLRVARRHGSSAWAAPPPTRARANEALTLTLWSVTKDGTAFGTAGSVSPPTPSPRRTTALYVVSLTVDRQGPRRCHHRRQVSIEVTNVAPTAVSVTGRAPTTPLTKAAPSRPVTLGTFADPGTLNDGHVERHRQLGRRQGRTTRSTKATGVGSLGSPNSHLYAERPGRPLRRDRHRHRQGRHDVRLDGSWQRRRGNNVAPTDRHHRRARTPAEGSKAPAH